MIYLDNAATSLNKPQCVIDAVVDAMKKFGNSGRSACSQSLNASRVIYEAREKIASLFGLDKASNVVFTSGATESLNIAINGLLNKGDHVITTDLEHNSVLRPLYALTKIGVEVSYVHADSSGNVNYDDFSKLIKPNTKAIITTHASNLTGNVLDISRIGALAYEHNLIYIVDASQTAGAFPINMSEMNIDVLVFTGHKSLLGPQGTGGLCVKEGIDIKPFKRGGSGVQSYLEDHPSEMPTKLEAGTLNGHGIAGLLAAITYINEVGISTIQNKEKALVTRFLDGISSIDGIKVYGDFGKEHAPIVALNWRDMDSTSLADELMEDFGIATRPGAHCAPRMHKALGTVDQGVVRFSFGYGNTFEEVDKAVNALKEICR
ncbi:MAG: aminotransferase class V-fold PLP-dependent enzyme [Saccharofermentans sp.]|nr:aminotransferase class V-fold PLP-dependent enzyme [Saccharofermentans sp.]